MASYHHNRRLSAQSAEDLLKDILNIPRPSRQPTFPTPMLPVPIASFQPPSLIFDHPLPLLPPPTPPLSPYTPIAEVVAYDKFFSSISTFSIPPSRSSTRPPQSQTSDAIRTFMMDLCRSQGKELHHACLKLPADDIPSGHWSLALAPGVLEGGGWVFIFATPSTSEFVWVFWSSSTSSSAPKDGAQEQEFMVQYLQDLVGNERLKSEQMMISGDARHKKLYEIVQQALWAEGNRPFLGADWRSGEFGGIY